MSQRMNANFGKAGPGSEVQQKARAAMMKSKRVQNDETAEVIGKALVEGHAESPQRGKELTQKLVKGIANDPTALHEVITQVAAALTEPQKAAHAAQVAAALTEPQKAAHAAQVAAALTEPQKAAHAAQVAAALPKEQLETLIAQLQAKLHGKGED